MKRGLTKKPQFEKVALAARPKRNLKFSHSQTEAETVRVSETPVAEAQTPESQTAEVYGWTSEAVAVDAPHVAPVALKKTSPSLIDRIVSVVLPMAGLAVLTLIVAALAQAGGYDAQFVASRLN